MGIATRKSRKVKAAAGGAFDPVSDVGWAHLWWAEGPEFEALALSDGNAVASWPDEIGTTDLSQSNNDYKPVYDASHASFGDAPVVDPDGSNDRLVSATFTLAQDFTFVAVTFAVDQWTTQALMDTAYPGPFVNLTDDNRTCKIQTGTTGFGASYNDAKYKGKAILLRCYFNGTSSAIAFNNAAATTGDASTGGFSAETMTLFSVDGGGTYSPNPTALVGLYDGDVTADAGWSDFVDWVSDHYGITMG